VSGRRSVVWPLDEFLAEHGSEDLDGAVAEHRLACRRVANLWARLESLQDELHRAEELLDRAEELLDWTTNEVLRHARLIAGEQGDTVQDPREQD
jgi:hypothetical protein